MSATSWKPTRKWMVATLGALGALAVMYLTTGSWDVEESVAAVGLVVTQGSSYLIPNDPENPA